jgi:hypothetical protein
VRLDPADGWRSTCHCQSPLAPRQPRRSGGDRVERSQGDSSTGAGIDVSGPITIDRAEIAIGAMQTASFPTVEVREINRPGVPNAPPPARPRRVHRRLRQCGSSST